MWAKIALAKRNPIYIFSFYRPRDPSTELYSTQLQISLNRLINQTIELLNIILSGDFNLPGMMAMVSLPRILHVPVNSITCF